MIYLFILLKVQMSNLTRQEKKQQLRTSIEVKVKFSFYEWIMTKVILSNGRYLILFDYRKSVAVINLPIGILAEQTSFLRHSKMKSTIKNSVCQTRKNDN
jgi:hypothetical protein